MAIAPPLSSGWGYGIVLGLGALFALGMVSSHATQHHHRRFLIDTTGACHVDSQALQS
jgi:hypothetical protein